MQCADVAIVDTDVAVVDTDVAIVVNDVAVTVTYVAIQFADVEILAACGAIVLFLCGEGRSAGTYYTYWALQSLHPSLAVALYEHTK